MDDLDFCADVDWDAIVESHKKTKASPACQPDTGKRSANQTEDLPSKRQFTPSMLPPATHLQPQPVEAKSKVAAPAVNSKGRIEAFFRPLQPASHGQVGAAPEAAQPLTPEEKVWSLILGIAERAWSHQLIQGHLGADTLIALFRTCTAARDALLPRLRTVRFNDPIKNWHLSRLLRRLGSGTPIDWALPELHMADLQLEPAMDMAQARPRWRCLQTSTLRLSAINRMPYADGMEVRLSKETDWGHDDSVIVCDVTTSTDRQQKVHLTIGKVGLGQVGDDEHEVSVTIQPGTTLRLRDQPAALRLGLSLLKRAVTPDNAKFSRALQLSGWTMTAPLIHELQSMPHWESLSFASLNWLPTPQPAYASLLRQLPRSIGNIYMSRGGTSDNDEDLLPDMLTDEQMIDIVLSAPRDRSPEDGLEIQLLHKMDRCDVYDAIEENMMDGSYPNVEVICVWTS